MRISVRRCACGSVLISLALFFFTSYLILSPFEPEEPLDFNSTLLSWLNPNANFDANGTLSRPYGSARLSSAVYLYGCHNIHRINIGEKLGNGVSKVAFLGTHGSRQVVVKMVTPDVEDIKACKRHAQHKMGDCYHFPVMKLMKEILVLQQLRHPNVLRLLGYCLRSDETEMTSPKQHGLIAVYERGDKIKQDHMRRWSLEKRMNVALQLMDLLIYLETHALGSLLFPDFKLHHFLMVGDRVKLIDVDDMSSQEAVCHPDNTSCPFDLTCVGHQCPGANAKHNLANFYNTFARLLFVSVDPDLSRQFKQLLADLQSMSLTASQVKSNLRTIIHGQTQL